MGGQLRVGRSVRDIVLLLVSSLTAILAFVIAISGNASAAGSTQRGTNTATTATGTTHYALPQHLAATSDEFGVVGFTTRAVISAASAASGHPSHPHALFVAADSEASAAAKALSRLPKSARVSEKPPAFDAQTWQWRSASRHTVGKDWWDPEGDEWRYHPADKYHDPHFDYNPWTQWNSPWQHLYPGR